MKKFFLFVFFITNIAFAQDKAQISGTVLDGEMNNEPLLGATVIVKGTTTGAQTDFDGNYNLSLEPGTHTLEFSYVGYNSIQETITIAAGENKVINKTLKANSLEEIVIVAETSKEKESALNIQQKKATTIETNIGAQELSRKGVGDVATAVTKTSGISKQEGSGNIFVRGLGDRYNSTTLNGLPIPSNDPSKKNISLDIFSTDIVEYISIDKNFQSKNSGDFGGANVNINSKDFRGKAYVELGLDWNANTNVMGESNFYLQDGPNFTGFYNDSYPNNPTSGYNFDTSWNRTEKNNAPHGFNFSLKGGKSFEVGENGKLSLFATASFDNGYRYTEGVSRGNVTAAGVANKDLTFQNYKYNTNTTFMTNLGYKINSDHKLNYNFLLINSSSQEHREFRGFIADIADENPGFVRRSNYEKTLLLINQILGKSKINDRIEANWGLSYNAVFNDTPDRMVNTLRPDIVNPDLLVVDDRGAISDNHRFYQELTENEIAGRLAIDYKFAKNADDEFKGKLTLGGGSKFKTVDFEATQFNFDITTPLVVDPYNLDAYFNQANFNSGLFSIKTYRFGQTDPLKPASYEGIQLINFGYANVEYNFSEKLTAVLGLRGEQIFQDIEWDTQISEDKNYFDTVEFLPSLSLKYALNDKQNLRFATSKTYTLPQFKERAQFQFEDVTTIEVGNPFLYPSTNYNADIKWEFFPKSSELISVTAFGKYIQDPINKVVIASSTNDISYVNTGDWAQVFGAEFELKKDIYSFDSENDHKIIGGFNLSYIYSNQEFDNEKVQRETNYSVTFTYDEGNLTGASPILLNTDITYLKEFSDNKNIQATLAYNFFNDRDFAIGTNFIGNTVEKSVGTLDLVIKSKLNERLGVSLSAKNLTNPAIEQTQENNSGDVIVNSYKRGTNLKLGLTYKF